LTGSILEIGLGGRGSFKYSSGIPGGSLLAMADFNTNLKVFGGDINPESVNAVEFESFQIDQTLEASISEFCSRMQKFGTFIMVIDDGHHQFESNVKTFFGLRSLVMPGGYYVVEDVHESHLELWNIFIECNHLNAQIFDLRSYRRGVKDNNLVFINF
jgi:cephalosporin hydroxylase